MVLSGTSSLSSANGLCRGAVRAGLNFEALTNLTLRKIFFNLCKGLRILNFCGVMSAEAESHCNALQGHKGEQCPPPRPRRACQAKTMASIPPSAFSAGRIRETQRDRDMKLSNTAGKGRVESKFFNTSLMELTPLKYNSKLMNSIWGFYNRYSPHNVKKINDALSFNVELQQSAANSTNKNEPVITLPSAKLDNMWAAINVSQSH